MQGSDGYRPASVLITGASAGLGLIAARELSALTWHVVLGCRDAARGEDAARTIREAVPAASTEVLEIDLASLASVRAAAERLVDEPGAGSRPPLRAVVCNAGIQVVNGVQRSQDGYELTFATNHLGHFLLVESLLDHITGPGRIVFVSSEVHQGPVKSMGFPAPRWTHPSQLADADTPWLGTSGHAGRVRYANSKLANIYSTYDLAPRLDGRGITVNAFDPGLMPSTGLDRDWPNAMQKAYHLFAPVLVKLLPGARSVERSGCDLAYIVDSPELDGVTGTYISGRSPRASSPESHDEARAAELRTASWELLEGCGAADR